MKIGFKESAADLHSGAKEKMDDIVFEKEKEELISFKESVELEIISLEKQIEQECGS